MAPGFLTLEHPLVKPAFSLAAAKKLSDNGCRFLASKASLI